MPSGRSTVEYSAHVDLADVAAFQLQFVGDGADDVTGFGAVLLAHLDAETFHFDIRKFFQRHRFGLDRRFVVFALAADFAFATMFSVAPAFPFTAAFAT